MKPVRNAQNIFGLATKYVVFDLPLFSCSIKAD